jgi:hypothetical protein
MIASWMLYALLVSVLLAAAAWAGEEVCRLLNRPVRWAWAAALAATVAMVAAAPLRPAPAPLVLEARVVAAPGGAVPRSAPAAGPLERIAAAWERAAAQVGRAVPGPVLGAGWGALSLAVLVVAAATLRRARGARRGWPVHQVAGTAVRVAPREGPAVLGVRAPEVVVPRWLLDAPPEEQRLVVLHEREHVLARDPLLLAAGCAAVAVVPWSPAAWWMLLRLRAAVELDCDARVLRRGVRPFAYGSLLIDMAGRGSGLSLGAPAMAASPSSLERRIRAMNVRLPRFAPVRAAALGVLSAALLVGACEAALPTTPEIERMDARTAERQAARFHVFGEGANLTYVVDGKAVSAEEARAIPADRIATVNVRRTGDTGTVEITTGEPGSGRVRINGEEIIRPGRPGGTRVTIMSMEAAGGERAASLVPAGEFEGLLVIDGQITDPSTMRTLNPDRIAHIEVMKGPAAAQQYPGNERAAKGVIRITTKAGGR